MNPLSQLYHLPWTRFKQCIKQLTLLIVSSMLVNLPLISPATAMNKHTAAWSGRTEMAGVYEANVYLLIYLDLEEAEAPLPPVCKDHLGKYVRYRLEGNSHDALFLNILNISLTGRYIATRFLYDKKSRLCNVYNAYVFKEDL